MASSAYLDCNATTPVDRRVLDAMLPALTGEFGNPSSVHAAGQRARALLEDAREELGQALGCEGRELVFTSGGTEANNLAVRGAAEGRAVAVGATEHPSVVEAARRRGTEVVVLPVDERGVISLDALDAALSAGVGLVSVMWANNETGVVAPVAELVERCRRAGALLHVDAVQALGKLPVDLHALGADFASVSAHKVHGPKGAGALYARRGVKLEAQSAGGGQERGRRGGTENVAGALGLARAATLAVAALAESGPRVRALRDRLEALALALPETRVNGAGAERLPGTLNVSFRGVEGEALLAALDLAGVAASSGSACHAGSVEPSPVLAAMGVPPEWARGAVRFSLSRTTTGDEVAHAERALFVAVAALRRPVD